MLKSLVKTIIGIVFYYTGAFELVRFVNNLLGKRLTIVTYHRVTDENIEEIQYSLPYLFVNIKTFEQHVSFYKKKYNIVSFKNLSEYERKRNIPKNSLIITFDDGYADNLKNALPILRKHDTSCTIFLVTGMLGRDEVPWWDEAFSRLRFLTVHEGENNKRKLAKDYPDIQKEYADNPARLFLKFNCWEKPRIRQLLEGLRACTSIPEDILREKNVFLGWKDLENMGDMVHFGSHGRSHLSLSGLDHNRIEQEVLLSKEELERESGDKVLAFSYPAGHHAKEVERIVQESGYLYGLTQDRGINNLENRYCIRRINVWEGAARGVNGSFSKAVFALLLSGIY